MFRHIFACLVHEEIDCVVDMVRNLRCLDDSSEILLYNGGPHPGLLEIPFPFADYGATVVPAPRSVTWGRLEWFALDVLKHACNTGSFDAITIVDSDQLLLVRGYVDCLRETLRRWPHSGLISTHADRIRRSTDLGPVLAGYRELPLWIALADHLGSRDGLFHWSFWPGTVITRRLAEACVALADTDLFIEFLERTRTWALEEVLFATLAAVCGMDVVQSPRDDRYLQYGTEFTPQDVDDALSRSATFWMHPVPRQYGHAVRSRIRERHAHYRRPSRGITSAASPQDVELSLPILHAMSAVEGWLEPDEAELLIAAVRRASRRRTGGELIVVEVGSYCGRSTTTLGLTLKQLGHGGRVYAIDPHQGCVGALDDGLEHKPASGDRFLANLAGNGAAPFVEPIRARSHDVAWSKPIDVLFIDALHDYVHVAVDFHHFEPWLQPGSLVAFHDYASYYPGVQAFVDDLLASGHYHLVHRALTLVLLERADVPAPEAPAIVSREPLVSCVMPTRNRPDWVHRSIDYFLSQTYARAELLIVDDGDAPLPPVPAHERIRYLRLDQPMVLGAKRNVACGWARGELIAHWDDDDWYARWRLAYQVEALGQTPLASVCGLRRLRYYDPARRAAWMYSCPEDQGSWAAGATLCFRADYWRRHEFPAWAHGEDTHFTGGVPKEELLILDDDRFIVAMIHADNTCPKEVDGVLWEPLDVLAVESLMAEPARGRDSGSQTVRITAL